MPLNRICRRMFFTSLFAAGVSVLHMLNPVRALFASSRRKENGIMLSKPDGEGKMSVEEAIERRRTVRSFGSKRIGSSDFSQLLHAAQGITEEGGFKRAAPSAGALYPLDVYAVLGGEGVEGLGPGVYHYVPSGNRIEVVTRGDKRSQLAKAALRQMWVADPPVSFVITAEYARIESKYGERGQRYAMIEAGHVGQNIFLQAEALGLKAGIVGAFVDGQVARILGVPENYIPLLIMPVGYQA